MAQLAQYEIGRDYSVARAVRSVFPLDILDRVDDHGIFCSALVAQVFVAAGAPSFRRTPVDRTTPASLYMIGGLIDLTLLVFRLGMIPHNAETMSALDGDRAPTLSARQTDLSAQCARAVWARVEALVTAYPEERLSAQPTFYSILKLVTEAIDLIELVPQTRFEAFIRDASALDADLAEFINKGDLAALLADIENGDSRPIMRAIAESFEGKPDIDLDATEGYLRAGVRQLAGREAAIAWESCRRSHAKA